MSPVPVLLAIVSDGCPHCVRLKPNLAAAANKYHGKVQTWALVAERSPVHGPTLAAEGVPTLMGFVGGEPVWRKVGAPDNVTLGAMYDDLVARPAMPTGGGSGGW